MVFITGDCHADFKRFSTKNFPDQKEMTRDDIVIICGDFGGIWNGGGEEEWWLKWLARKKFTIVFVDGNHENFDRLNYEFPVVDFHGGKAHKIKNNVYHLMRGYVFDFEGKKFFAFGGASSHDIRDGILDRDNFQNHKEFFDVIKQWSIAGKMFRINHVSWWAEELPTEEEMQRGREALTENGNRVDFIISHCCPQVVATMMGYRGADILTQYFNEIAASTEFGRWYFGHYHDEQMVMYKYRCLYERIERII